MGFTNYSVSTPWGVFTTRAKAKPAGLSVFRASHRMRLRQGYVEPGGVFVQWHRTPQALNAVPVKRWQGPKLGTFLIDGRPMLGEWPPRWHNLTTAPQDLPADARPVVGWVNVPGFRMPGTHGAAGKPQPWGLYMVLAHVRAINPAGAHAGLRPGWYEITARGEFVDFNQTIRGEPLTHGIVTAWHYPLVPPGAIDATPSVPTEERY